MVLTNREQILRRYGLPKDASLSLPELATLTKIPTAALLAVHSRGMGAAKSNLESVRLKRDFSKNPDIKRFPKSARLTPQQWAMGRVYAFANHTKSVFYGADNDIARKYGLV